MATYEGNANVVESMLVTSENLAEVSKVFGFTLRDGQLFDQRGTLVNTGVWVVKFADGAINLFTDQIFKRLFKKIEPPKYKLSDIPDFSRDIKRSTWGDIYLRNEGCCFIEYDQDGAVVPYTFTAEDFIADDWQIKE